MTSTVCHRFVQNAWKKERCSNCFKSKEEHVSLKREAPVNKRPLMTVTSTAKSRGIIKNTIGTPGRRKRTVSFKPELTEIIGFGGEDWSEAEEEDTVEERSSESSEDDTSDLSEDDKDLDKLTKTNTEQNANITATTTSDRRRTFTQLMLGQPQKDSDGKKQTLLVSVTPFGQNDESERTPPKRASKTISHIPIAKNKEILVEARPKVVLTSYLKSRESPEPTKADKLEKIDIKKDNEALPAIKETLCDKDIQIQEKQVPNNFDKSLNVKNESKQTVNSDKLVTKTIENTNANSNSNSNSNSSELSDDISDRIYDDVADEDEPAEIVETINESSVLKKVEVVSVSSKETSPVLETPLNEQIVKSELKVQLSTTPLKHLENTQNPNLPLSHSNSQGQDSSSEESADSLGPAESREQAGEPDGRADPDVPCEPPALPRSPPPMITPPPRSSFLHGVGSNGKGVIAENKPKVPSKPEKVAQMVRKSSLDLSPLQISQNDQNKLSNKRRAPNPPPTTSEDITIETIEPQQPQEIPLNIETIPLENRIYSNINPPEEKVENILSTPEPIPPLNLTPINTPIQSTTPVTTTPSSNGPEPVPRKNISMSSDNLLYVEKSEEKRKDKTKTRFSLMKFLRVGGNSGKSSDKSKLEDVKEKHVPFPKPRLVIVHPLDLNGTIEVVASNVEDCPTQTKIVDGLPPAPPPRNLPQKSDELKPPPKSDDIIRKHRQLPLTPQKTSAPQAQTPTVVNHSNDNVYANLGEVRSGLAPSKPQRTASMREREALMEQQQQQQLRRKQNENLSPQEHVYERVAPPRRHSDESNNNVSLSGSNKGLNLNLKNGSYAGSESDLEIYSPCGSYYGAECEISDRGCSRPCQLRSRKGRSIVHKNLEDNYGAVVVANHEALAQVLEHLHLSPTIPSSLRGLQSASILHWSDFSIVDTTPSIIVGRRSFYHALWGAHHVTLSVSKDQVSLHKHPVGLAAFSLNPVTEFSDLLDGKYLPGDNSEGNKELIQASVTVFPWMQIDTIESLGTSLKSKNTSNIEVNRDACFTLLQFVNSLKTLQAQGIEEIPLSLSNFILCHDVDKDTHHRLCLLQGFSEETRTEKFGSLCQCAQVALDELFTNTKLAILIKTLLKKESAMSLSQVKSILEFSLWGPSDVAQGVPIKERELALQRWLDLERATVLHGLVGTRVQLSVLEEYHLLFLVRSSAKMMCEASTLLETNGVS